MKFCEPCEHTLEGFDVVELSIPEMIKIAAKHLFLDANKIVAKTRKREYVVARQMVMTFAKGMNRWSLKDIGMAFGGRDHTTVIHSMRVFKDLHETDPEFRSIYAGLVQSFKNPLTHE